MSGIILRVKAFKVSNKGGGLFHVPGNKVKDDGDKHRLYAASDTGSDYVHWICPKCKHRNKQSMFEHENYVPANNADIPFKCRMCRITVEVEPPAKPMKQESLIMAPDEFTHQMAQRRAGLAAGRLIV